MRFDDTLATVLAGDLESPFGMQSAWRQLVDLIGRRRVQASAQAIEILHAIRDSIPLCVRAASARALEYADPPSALVRLLAVDEIAVALPVLRTARLSTSEWTGMLSELSPPARTVLRNRRDLSPGVRRALESYGAVDFVLPDFATRVAADAEAPRAPAEAQQAESAVDVLAAEPAPAPAEPAAPIALAPFAWPALEEVVAAELPAEAPEPLPETEGAEPVAGAPTAIGIVVELAPPVLMAVEPEATGIVCAPPRSETLSEKWGLDGVAEADAVAHGPDMKGEADPVALGLGAQAPTEPPLPPVSPPSPDTEGLYRVADVVARIEDFWRRREDTAAVEPVRTAEPPASSFRFETDAKGVLRWVEGVSRTAVIGLSLDLAAMPGAAGVDGAAAGAFRRRAGFCSARLVIAGESDAAGAWRISAIPVFDPANGRFTGYRGTARRPRPDEQTEPQRESAASSAADSLRQLVHELRTPTSAISGFAEMIERQMLGPVPDAYRDRAGEIRQQARTLLEAIEDLDLAARMEVDTLPLRPARIALRPVLARIADDLAQLAEIRGAWLALPIDNLAVLGDPRAVERLLARLLATLVSAASSGERVGIRLALEGDDTVAIAIDRPRAFAEFSSDAMLGLDDEGEDATLLGTGFALRLARNLSRELGGSLVIERDCLTLRLPAAVNRAMEQAHLN